MTASASILPNPTIPPSALVLGAHHLRRYVIRPYGRKPAAMPAVSVTLSLWNTACPSAGPGTTPFIGWRLYVQDPSLPGASRRGIVVWEADNYIPAPDQDVTDIAVAIFEHVTTRPGDKCATPVDHTQWTPAQLDFAIRHGIATRAEARRRLARSPEELTPLRTDLEVQYSKRKDLGARDAVEPRHWLRFGLVSANGHTKREAQDALNAAIANHVSHKPEFRVRNGNVYALLAEGSEYVIQVIHPDRPDAPLGDVLRFQAKDVQEAAVVFDGMLARLGAPAVPALPQTPRKRPAARAPRTLVKAHTP